MIPGSEGMIENMPVDCNTLFERIGIRVHGQIQRHDLLIADPRLPHASGQCRIGMTHEIRMMSHTHRHDTVTGIGHRQVHLQS